MHRKKVTREKWENLGLIPHLQTALTPLSIQRKRLKHLTMIINVFNFTFKKKTLCKNLEIYTITKVGDPLKIILHPFLKY